MTLAGLNFKNHFLSFENVCLTEVKQIGLIFQFKYYNFCHLEDFITEGFKWVIHKIFSLEAANPFFLGVVRKKNHLKPEILLSTAYHGMNQDIFQRTFIIDSWVKPGIFIQMKTRIPHEILFISESFWGLYNFYIDCGIRITISQLQSLDMVKSPR